jgi:hypothetical protein
MTKDSVGDPNSLKGIKQPEEERGVRFQSVIEPSQRNVGHPYISAGVSTHSGWCNKARRIQGMQLFTRREFQDLAVLKRTDKQMVLGIKGQIVQIPCTVDQNLNSSSIRIHLGNLAFGDVDCIQQQGA